MDWNHKAMTGAEAANDPTTASAAQLRELVDLCRRNLERDAPGAQLPMGVLANDSLLVLSMSRLSETCGRLGDVATARQLYRLLLPYQERLIIVTTDSGERRCAAAYFIGLVATSIDDLDAAIDHFERALRINHEIGAAYDLAQTRYAYASALVLRNGPGDWVQARALLSETVRALSAHEPDAPPALPTAAGVSAQTPGAAYVFRADGDYWTVAFDSRPFHVRDVRGLHYIGRLLQQPHHDVHVLDLVGPGGGDMPRQDRGELASDGFSITPLDAVLPVLDSRARRAYVGRLRDLRSEQSEAARNNDVGRAAALQREITFLGEQLLAASRPTRCASSASPVERARISVRNAITAAIKVIAPHSGELARHLRNAIRTGTTCCYAPDRRVAWRL